MPPRVFAKPPLERKPFCLDLDSPVLRRIALRHIRAAAANAPIRFSEMLPDSDHCWLGDADALALHERAAAAMRRLPGGSYCGRVPVTPAARQIEREERCRSI